MTTANTYKERIEKLVSEWNKISSKNDWNIWSEKIKNEKFGTYGTISIFEVVENTQIKFQTSWVKDSFINECNDAIKGIKLG
tara:strand:- start:7753 stop:7998 length:246 start_codon:yes stop_codon:yes gene_type:complete